MKPELTEEERRFIELHEKTHALYQAKMDEEKRLNKLRATAALAHVVNEDVINIPDKEV